MEAGCKPHAVANLAWPWRYQPFGPFSNPKIAKGPPVLPKGFGGFGGFESVAPVVFIQYASDLGPTEARIGTSRLVGIPMHHTDPGQPTAPEAASTFWSAGRSGRRQTARSAR